MGHENGLFHSKAHSFLPDHQLVCNHKGMEERLNFTEARGSFTQHLSPDIRNLKCFVLFRFLEKKMFHKLFSVTYSHLLVFYMAFGMRSNNPFC